MLSSSAHQASCTWKDQSHGLVLDRYTVILEQLWLATGTCEQSLLGVWKKTCQGGGLRCWVHSSTHRVVKFMSSSAPQCKKKAGLFWGGWSGGWCPVCCAPKLICLQFNAQTPKYQTGRDVSTNNNLLEVNNCLHNSLGTGVKDHHNYQADPDADTMSFHAWRWCVAYSDEDIMQVSVVGLFVLIKVKSELKPWASR